MSAVEKTVKLFDDTAYLMDFEAVVVSCEARKTKEEETVYDVILDRTAFFPEQGGQSCDKGVLADLEVLYVGIEDDVVTHTLKAPLEVGTEVEGHVDVGHRFMNMQQHSAEHLFSGLAHTLFGCTNVGFHLSEREVTVDFDKALTEEDLRLLESGVNDVITSNIKSEILYPTKEEEKTLDYRSKKEIAGQTRLVRYPGVDLCACCAPHVKRTGEIGLFKVVSFQNYKGGIRVWILAGKRAFDYMNARTEEMVSIARMMSTSTTEVAGKITAMQEDIRSLKAAAQKAEARVLALTFAALPEDEAVTVLFMAEADSKAVRNAVTDRVAEKGGVTAVFIGSDETGYHYVLGASEGRTGALNKALKDQCGARGGGKEIAEGNVSATAEQLRAVVAAEA
ncbi:MAG: alanine--tRNA ligase-related protein [Lachnospiraceae bacterium]|nr:alanine--tRNA ligase-related protein [Lachnospiraceae bacterium]